MSAWIRTDSRSAMYRVVTTTIVAALASMLSLALATRHLPVHTGVAAPGVLATALVLPLFTCFRSIRRSAGHRFDPFEPGVIVAAFFYLNIVIPAAWSYASLGFQTNWTDLGFPAESQWFATMGVAVWSLIFFGLGYRSASRTGPLQHSTDADTSSARVTFRLTHAEWGFLVVALLIGAALRIQRYGAYGLSSFLEILSPSLRIANLPQISLTALTVESLFDWSVLLFFFHSLVTRRREGYATAAVIAGALASFLVTGKRSSVLVYAIPPVIWYHYLRHWISFGRAAAIAVAGVLVLIVGLLTPRFLVVPFLSPDKDAYDRFVGHVARHQLQFYMNSPDLSTWDMTVASVTQRTEILQESHGAARTFLTANFEGFAYLVPRQLWPGKPSPAELGQHYYRRFVGGTSENVGFTVGIIGAWFLLGALPGLALAMLALGLLLRLAYVRLRPWEGQPGRVSVYSILMLGLFLLVRFGTLSFTILDFTVYYMPGLVLFLLLQRRGKETSPVPSGAARFSDLEPTPGASLSNPC